MIIKNVSTKIVNVGAKILMPDDSFKASDAISNAPAVQALKEKGLLEITAEPKKNMKAAEDKKPVEDKKTAEDKKPEGEQK